LTSRTSPRDIVRIATVAHLVDTSVLDDDFVLTGGMALRLRGSNRFTIKDTDSSLRGRLDELELAGKLRLDDDQLQVYPDPGTNWGRKTPKLVDVKPIKYEAYFASVTGDPIEGHFSFTVSQRGLFERAERLALRHPYPELVFEQDDLSVPVMHIAEQAAEKVVGWAAGSLVKHYLDLAWIGREFGETLIAEDFQRLVQRKLDVGFEIFPGAYGHLREIKDLLIPLHRPREWQGPRITIGPGWPRACQPSGAAADRRSTADSIRPASSNSSHASRSFSIGASARAGSGVVS
jgi:hypothetical protein